MSSVQKSAQKSLPFMANQSTGYILKAVEGTTVPVADGLLKLMNISQSPVRPLQIFDGGCGVGAVAGALFSLAPQYKQDVKMVCGDVAPHLTGILQARAKDEWPDSDVTARVMNVMDTGLSSMTFSHATLNLVLHMVPDPDAALVETLRILRPGGTVGISTFDGSNADMMYIPDLRGAFKALPFDAPFPDPFPMQLHDKGSWTNAGWIETHLSAPPFSLEEVKVEVFQYSMSIEGTEDFIGRFGMMADYVVRTFWTEEQQNKFGSHVRPTLQKYLDEKYGADTVRSMQATAIVTCGNRPV